MNRRSTKHLCALLFGCALASVVLTSPTYAVIFDVGFGLGVIPGSEYYSKYSALEDQKAKLSLSLEGNIFADGGGTVLGKAFKFTAPLNHFVVWPTSGGPIPTDTSPTTSPAYTKIQSNPHVLEVDAVSNFGLDLLNGQSATFALSATATTNSVSALTKNIPVDFAGTLSSLSFQQTASATGGSWIDGDVTAVIQLQPTFSVLLDSPVSLTITAPAVLRGNWSTSAGFSSTILSLDGDLDVAIPLSLATSFTASLPDLMTVTSTVELQASLLVNVAYHLEQTFIPTPEPGSIVLLGIGLAGVTMYGLGRRSARSKGS